MFTVRVERCLKQRDSLQICPEPVLFNATLVTWETEYILSTFANDPQPEGTANVCKDRIRITNGPDKLET